MLKAIPMRVLPQILSESEVERSENLDFIEMTFFAGRSIGTKPSVSGDILQEMKFTVMAISPCLKSMARKQKFIVKVYVCYPNFFSITKLCITTSTREFKCLFCFEVTLSSVSTFTS